MTDLSLYKLRKSKNNSLYIKFALYIFLLFFFAFMLLRFPETAGQGISDGVDICLGTLIPSLYPFLIVSSLMINLNITAIFERYLSGLSKALFNLPGKCVGVILLSLTGGFPVGGKMVRELYLRGEISEIQAKRLLLFCVCPGPAFTISSVGFYMLGSKKAGLIIYISLVISSLLMGIVLRFFTEYDSYKYRENFAEEPPGFSDALLGSVSSGSSSMLSICAWVIIFSCVNKLIEIMPLTSGFKLFLFCITEVTNGCLVSCGNLPVPIIAGIIGFGGICTHFQVMSAVTAVKLKYKYFITARVVNAGLAVFICKIIMHFFPVSYDVISFGTMPESLSSGVSVPISLGMLLMCAFIMLGDNFKVSIKKKKT